MPKPTLWKDEYTLLCERCGYIIEDLDQSLPCPECRLSIRESQPEIRRTFEWKGCSRVSDLFDMARITLKSPRWLLEHTKMHVYLSEDLRSYWVLIAVLILASTSSLAIILSENWIQGLVLFPLYMFQAWMQIAIYTWLARILFAYLANKRGKRMHPNISKTIFNYGCLGWVIASLGGVFSAPAIGIAERTSWTTSLRAVNGLGISIFAIGIGYIIFFAYMGYKFAGYANQTRTDANE